MPSILHKYAAALLHVAITLGGVIGTAFAAPATLSVWLQIAVVTAGSVVTYVVPLLDSKWRAALKVLLGGVLPAAVAAAIPFIPATGFQFEPANVLPLVVAVLAAVGAQFGVDIRSDAEGVSSAVAAINEIAPIAGTARSDIQHLASETVNALDSVAAQYPSESVSQSASVVASESIVAPVAVSVSASASDSASQSLSA